VNRDGCAASIIQLKDRSKAMIIQNLTTIHPFRHIEKNGALLPPGGLAAVLSPAGVGKTAFVVQVAIDAMIRGEYVLHVSLGDSIDKITLWYGELFQNLARHHDLEQSEDAWRDILLRRFIMTFKVAAFSIPVLEERISDLVGQNIFKPSLLIIDGLNFDNNQSPRARELKDLAESRKLSIWVTGNVHREDTRDPDGVPSPFVSSAPFFDGILELEPGDSGIAVTALRGFTVGTDDTRLRLDPATMLIQS
jgi:hypothetical protein